GSTTILLGKPFKGVSFPERDGDVWNPTDNQRSRRNDQQTCCRRAKFTFQSSRCDAGWFLVGILAWGDCPARFHRQPVSARRSDVRNKEHWLEIRLGVPARRPDHARWRRGANGSLQLLRSFRRTRRCGLATCDPQQLSPRPTSILFPAGHRPTPPAHGEFVSCP